MIPREQHRMAYMASLDGIRAIAIVAVLLFHVWPVALIGGFTGVDVFFVLSGFLITSIVLHDIRDGSFSLREFYLRRIQRLLPNIIVLVLSVLVLWTLLLPPSSATQPARHGLWTLFNLSNIYIWDNLGGYWGTDAEWAPLTHTWSLGIEEQFYLFFPGTLLLLTRFQPSRVWIWLTVATVFSFGICLYGTQAHPTATFYLLPARVWELLLGAVVAVHHTSIQISGAEPLRGSKTRQAMGWIGLGAIIAGFFSIRGGNKFPGLASLVPTLGTAFVLLSITSTEARISRLLSMKFMVRMGKLSYSLYLWHWPLIILGKLEAESYGLPQLGGAAAGCLVGILLGWGAYVWIEQPLRKRGPGRSWRLAAIAAGFIVVVFYCGAIVARRQVTDPTHPFDTPTWSAELFNASKAWDHKLRPKVAFNDVYFPPLPPRSDGSWRTGGVIHRFGGSGHPKVVVLGSSHALMYSRLIDDLCGEMNIPVAFLGVHNTPVFFAERVNEYFPTSLKAHEFDEARRNWLRVWRPEIVFIIDRWGVCADSPQDFDVKLRSFLGEVCPLAGRVIFVTQVPILKVPMERNLRELVTARMISEKGLPRLDPDSKERIWKQSIVLAEAAKTDFPNLRILRADLPFIQRDGSIRYASGRSFFYADDNHLTDIGTEEVRFLFKKAITDDHLAFPIR